MAIIGKLKASVVARIFKVNKPGVKPVYRYDWDFSMWRLVIVIPGKPCEALFTAEQLNEAIYERKD